VRVVEVAVQSTRQHVELGIAPHDLRFTVQYDV
jgi:hypothetical protein